MRLVLLATLATATASSAASARGGDKVVVVNGARYRVTTDRGLVTVNKKAAIVRYSIAERDAQREAVRLATGCRPVDELAGSARLKAKLDCAER